LGLIIAFVLPGLFIDDYTPETIDRAKALGEYQIFGLVAAILIITIAGIFIKYTPREKKEFNEDYKKAPNFFNSIKMCVKSKSFMWYIPAEIANWFVYGMLAVIVILYAKFVLGVQDTLIQALLLGVAFLSSVIFITVLWRPVVRKIGPRKSWLLSMSIWIITLMPLLLIDNWIAGMIVFFFIGIGLAGSLYIIDLIIADIVDEDELNTGARREASYYGVNAFFLRLSTIFVFLAIGLVFTTTGWGDYSPNPGTDVILGLRILVAIFPAIALGIAILVIYKYPLDGERLRKVKEDLQKLHEEKKSKI